MNSIEIPEKDLYVEYPSSWGELTDDQFEYIMQNWLLLMDEKISYDEFNLIVLYRLLGMKHSPFQGWKDRKLTREQLEDKFSNIWMLTETLKWLFRHENNVYTLNYYEVNNRLPVIKNRWDEKLYGLGDGMLDITFGELRHAWSYFKAYTRDRKTIDLDRLIAVLYRPEKKNIKSGQTNIREPFRPDLTDHYADLLKDLPFWKKYTIYSWFFNCDKLIKEGELLLDGEPISFASLFKKPEDVDSEEVETLDETDLGHTALLYTMAETKLFGPTTQVDRTKYLDILTALLHWQQQANKIKTR